MAGRIIYCCMGFGPETLRKLAGGAPGPGAVAGGGPWPGGGRTGGGTPPPGVGANGTGEAW